MVLDGSWIGIIHDIIINGITYSSVAGVLGGNPLPFTSCFGTMVVAPFSCANGQNPPPYSRSPPSQHSWSSLLYVPSVGQPLRPSRKKRAAGSGPPSPFST